VESAIFQNLFFVLLAALTGGLLVRVLKLPLLIGYVLAGITLSFFYSTDLPAIHGLAEVGLVLLLFSIGLELSLSRLARTGSVAVLGAVLQMLLVSAATFAVLYFFGVAAPSALVLSVGFSLSSTALVVKLLEDKAETDAIHGEIMIGWLLTQDLAVIPIFALLSVLASDGGDWLTTAGQSLALSALVVSLVFFLGRLLAPFIIHSIASAASRELLVLAGVCLALGTAFLVSFFGVSPALGAFLAGVVISETQENHALFSETRPLRNLFVVIFFVTLGFFVNPELILGHLPTILALSLFVILLKCLVVYFLLRLFGYRGKVNLAVALGLSQVGEFSFVIFLQSNRLGLLSDELTAIGIATTLFTLLATPLLFRSITPLWRRLQKYTRNKLPHKSIRSEQTNTFQDHIIICGYGRMGSWIGKALDRLSIPFVVIDYNQNVVRRVHMQGIPVIFGDPAESSILIEAGIAQARALIVAIPDRITQEEVISFCQTKFPKLPIYARAHLDEDHHSLTQFKVKRVIQPEFEAALSVVREILLSSGKDKQQISQNLKNLRRFHTMK